MPAGRAGVMSKPAASAAWSPASLSGLTVWIDASSAASFTYSSGVVVSQWNDLSGNGHHFTQSSGSSQPSRSGTQNGLATVVFDGADDYMDTASFTLAQPHTILMAAKFQNSSSFTNLAGQGDEYQPIYGATFLASYAGAGYTIQGGGTFTSGAHVVTQTVNGASSLSWVDGASAGSGDPGSNGITTGLRLSERALRNYFRDELYELIVCSGVMSSGDRATAEAYLKAKWGTP